MNSISLLKCLNNPHLAIFYYHDFVEKTNNQGEEKSKATSEYISIPVLYCDQQIIKFCEAGIHIEETGKVTFAEIARDWWRPQYADEGIDVDTIKAVQDLAKGQW